jgi:hypothetical protein
MHSATRAQNQIGTRQIFGINGRVYDWHGLALQLSFLLSSESMGNHDSDIVDADGVG